MASTQKALDLVGPTMDAILSEYGREKKAVTSFEKALATLRTHPQLCWKLVCHSQFVGTYPGNRGGVCLLLSHALGNLSKHVSSGS